MPEFTYPEISDEMTRLGYTYPTDADFSKDEITAAVENLADYELTVTVASLRNKNGVSADALAAFAKLAGILGAPVRNGYECLEALKATTPAERRRAALQNLKSKRNEEFREVAKRSLERASSV